MKHSVYFVINGLMSDRCLDFKNDHWTIADELVKNSSSFEVATTFFICEEKVSASSVLPILHGLLQHFIESEDDEAVIGCFKMIVAKEIKRRWNIQIPDPTDILVLASAVDPRFKNLTFIAEDIGVRKEVISELVDKMKDFDESEQQCAEDDEPQEPASKRKKSALICYLAPQQKSCLL